MTADDAASRLADIGAPALVAEIEAHRAEIEAHAGIVGRFVLDRAIPSIEAHAPALCLGVNRRVVAEMARWTLADALAFLVASAAAEGVAAHPTILQAHP